jgi:DNA-binding transcriptional LysR family regulator
MGTVLRVPRSTFRNTIDLNGIDLNLLPKFRAVYRARSVSQAGKELHLTQSAISNSLAKLRAIFDDELFVRTSDGMEPTALAHGLAEPIDRALAKLETGFDKIHAFAPDNSARTFRIAATQLGEAWLVPKIINFTKAAAPNVSVEAVPARGKALGDKLRDGTADFGIGYFSDFGHGSANHELGAHAFVGISRKGHPLFANVAGSSWLSECEFVEVIDNGTHYSDVGHALIRSTPPEVTRFKISSVLAVPFVVAQTDLVAVVPVWFAERHAVSLGLNVVHLPSESSVASLRLSWHTNRLSDAGHVWMRSIISQAAVAANLEDATTDVRAVASVTDGPPRLAGLR